MTDDELLALARKATPGEWRVSDEDVRTSAFVSAPRYGHVCNAPVPYSDWHESERNHDSQARRNIAYIAAAHPAAIIAMIKRHRAKVERLTKERDEARGEYNGMFAAREAAESALAAERKRAGELQGTVAFFASVIKSGEPWTQTCEDALRAALAGKEPGNG